MTTACTTRMKCHSLSSFFDLFFSLCHFIQFKMQSKRKTQRKKNSLFEQRHRHRHRRIKYVEFHLTCKIYVYHYVNDNMIIWEKERRSKAISKATTCKTEKDERKKRSWFDVSWNKINSLHSKCDGVKNATHNIYVSFAVQWMFSNQTRVKKKEKQRKKLKNTVFQMKIYVNRSKKCIRNWHFDSFNL